jgi:acyl-CoA thioester hydrolase
MTMTTLAAGDDLLRPAPFLSSVMQIEPQWIDYNGHLNMAYYNVMFDRAIDELWLELGIGPGYMKARHGSTFTAECHVRYLREIHLGDPVQVSILLVGADEKRLHTFEELRHASEGWLSATSENMTIHIDMTARKTAPFPPIFAPASGRGERPQRGGAARGHRAKDRDALRNNSSDPGAAARHADHGREQKQHHGDEEDRLGDFDGYAGDAAEAQNAGDQRDDQERNDPAQHHRTSVCNPCFKIRATENLAPALEIIRRRNKCSGPFRGPETTKILFWREQNQGWRRKSAPAAATG